MSSASAASEDVRSLSSRRPAEPRAKASAGALADQLFRALAGSFAALVLVAACGMLIVLVHGAWPALKTFRLGFLAGKEWNPVTNQFGALAPLYGTVVTSLIALLVGVPVSFGIARLVITELAAVLAQKAADRHRD